MLRRLCLCCLLMMHISWQIGYWFMNTVFMPVLSRLVLQVEFATKVIER